MLKTHLKRVIFLAIIGALVGMAVYQFSPKVYEAKVQLLIATEPTPTNSAMAETPAASILSTGVSQNVATEVSILRSRGLFEESLRRLPQVRTNPELLLSENLEPLYTMYDVLGERESRAAMIVVKAHDPKLAADLANEVYDVYNDLRQKSADESVAHATTVLEDQSKRVAGDLKKAETKLSQFKVKNGIADLTSKSGQLVNYQGTLTQQLDTAKAELAVQQATLTATRARLNDRPKLTSSGYVLTESPIVSNIQNVIAGLETKRAELLRTYNEGSSKIKDVDAQIAAAKIRLVNEQKGSWRQTTKTMERDAVRQSFEDTLLTGLVNKSSLGRRVAALNAALAAVNSQIKSLPKNEMEMAGLTRNQQLLESKFRNLQAALSDLRYKGSAGMQQARMLYPATENTRPVAPDLLKLLVVCTMGGAIFGFLYSLARESLRATAQTSHELSNLLGLPVAATVPLLPPRQAKSVFRSLPDASFKPLESFKFMAFAMLYGKDNPPKRVLFTSVGGAVGCSTSSAQYAIAASKTGVNVILVDADLRHETITKAFDVEGKSGLREVINCLLLPSDTAEISIATPHPTLRVVPSGSSGGDGITDVPVGNISAFLDDLQTRANLIVIDAPPCDVVSDALRFAPYVDEVVLVCSARTTKYTNVLPAVDLLKRAGAESVRLVMTGTSPEEEAFSRRSLYVVH